MFDRLVWQRDRMLLDGLVFRMEHGKRDDWELGSECFHFYKTKALVDSLEAFFTSRPAFAPRNVLELGIWDGGSVALWVECLRPDKHVAIDLWARGDSDYYRRYVASRGLEGRVKTYWGTDQADAARLRQIVAAEFTGPLDLVIDDASHVYELTKASFEALFPLVRPGGVYLIEDWAWAHMPEFQGPDGFFADKTELTRLAFELVEAHGSSPGLIANLTFFRDFIAVERGEEAVADGAAFRLDAFISRRPPRRRPPGVIRKLLSRVPVVRAR